MISLLSSYRHAIARPIITAGSLIVYLISQIIILTIVAKLGHDMLGIQTTLSQEKFLAIARSWESSGLMDTYYLHFYLDFIHPVIYGLFLSSFMALAFNRRSLSGTWNFMLLLPYLAAACDLIENGMHVYLLSDLSRVTREAVLFSGICTNLKWTIAFICLFGTAAFFFTTRKNATA
ncbi:MAG TPA: hypothetical protein PK573_11100 [Spirochaetota bacterium]|nr:hypothetical protein [Spirochaetota bacterium]HSA15558.1 hypothetical protein [Spirochaetota bacterium]